MSDDKIKRCESCGVWAMLDEVHQLMGLTHLCAFCFANKKRRKNAT